MIVHLEKKWWTYSNFSETVSSGFTMYRSREADMMAPLLTWKLEVEVFFFQEKITNHRVVGLPIVVESDLVKSPTAWLPPDVLLNNLHNASSGKI